MIAPRPSRTWSSRTCPVRGERSMSRSGTRTRAQLALTIALALAAPAYAQRPEKGEDESAALVDEGRAAFRANHLDAAANALAQSIALNPRPPDAYVLRTAIH